jgi:hypothetical protein
LRKLPLLISKKITKKQKKISLKLNEKYYSTSLTGSGSFFFGMIKSLGTKNGRVKIYTKMDVLN